MLRNMYRRYRLASFMVVSSLKYHNSKNDPLEYG
jgi:hypothetical protein